MIELEGENAETRLHTDALVIAEICILTNGTPGQSYYQKQKARREFCKRAGIKPVILHLKADHWIIRNYLRGTHGGAINTMMATAA